MTDADEGPRSAGAGNGNGNAPPMPPAGPIDGGTAAAASAETDGRGGAAAGGAGGNAHARAASGGERAAEPGGPLRSASGPRTPPSLEGRPGTPPSGAPGAPPGTVPGPPAPATGPLLPPWPHTQAAHPQFALAQQAMLGAALRPPWADGDRVPLQPPPGAPSPAQPPAMHQQSAPPLAYDGYYGAQRPPYDRPYAAQDPYAAQRPPGGAPGYGPPPGYPYGGPQQQGQPPQQQPPSQGPPMQRTEPVMYLPAHAHHHARTASPASANPYAPDPYPPAPRPPQDYYSQPPPHAHTPQPPMAPASQPPPPQQPPSGSPYGQQPAYRPYDEPPPQGWDPSKRRRLDDDLPYRAPPPAPAHPPSEWPDRPAAQTEPAARVPWREWYTTYRESGASPAPSPRIKPEPPDDPPPAQAPRFPAPTPSAKRPDPPPPAAEPAGIRHSALPDFVYQATPIVVVEAQRPDAYHPPSFDEEDGMLKRERTSKKHDEKIRRDAFKAQLNQLVEAIPGMAAYADTRKAIVVHAREYVTQIRDREKRLRAAWMAARRREKACEELLGRKGVGRGEIDAGMPGPAGEEDVARMGEELEELLEGMAPPEVPGRRYEPPRPGIAAAAGYLPLSSASAGGERQGGVSPGASFEAAQNLASLSAPARAPGWTGPGAAAGAGGAYRASPPSQPQPAPPPPGPAGLHSSSGPAAIQSGYASRENSMGTPGWPAYPAAAGTPPGPPGPAGYPRPPQQQQQGGWYYPPGPPPPGQQGQGPPPGWPGRPYYGYPSGPQ